MWSPRVCSVLELGGMEWNHSIPLSWNRSIPVFGLDKKLLLNLVNQSVTAACSTSSGRIGRTGVFRIWAEYSLSGNGSIPLDPGTER